MRLSDLDNHKYSSLRPELSEDWRYATQKEAEAIQRMVFCPGPTGGHYQTFNIKKDVASEYTCSLR